MKMFLSSGVDNNCMEIIIEIIKGLLNGVVMGLIAGPIVIFLDRQFLYPWIKMRVDELGAEQEIMRQCQNKLAGELIERFAEQDGLTVPEFIEKQRQLDKQKDEVA